MIVTTNLPPEELKDAVGLRVFDRLRDGATFVHLVGRSKRGKRAA
jgi:hypothetical protein